MPSTPHIEASEVFPNLQQEVARISALPEVRAAFGWLRTQEPQFAQWQLDMARIPAPPFGEAARGAWLRERFSELDLEGVSTDDVGNVFGLRPGSGGPCIALSAHLDTVFPAVSYTHLDVYKRQVLSQTFRRCISRTCH